MNKRERMAAASMVAEWEWSTNGSASEAAAMSNCAREVIRVLDLPDEDVQFARTYRIFQNMADTENDELFDALDDMIEQCGYEAVVDEVEANGFVGLHQRLTAALAQKGEGR